MSRPKVLIQKLRDDFPTINHYVAWLGFGYKGYQISYFQWEELQSGKVILTPDQVVVGAMGTVRLALVQLGLQDLDPLNIPDCLTGFCGRAVYAMSLGEIKKQVEGGELGPVFIKPLKIPKLFTGHVVSKPPDLIASDDFEETTAVLCSEVVRFVSEWRYYVQGHQIIGVGHYRGDWFVHPDKNIVTKAVKAYQSEAPVAYAIDFGVTDEGRTLLVEVNDAYALGCYGLGARKYGTMLESRWFELMKKI